MPLGGALTLGGATFLSGAGQKKAAGDQQALERQRIDLANQIGAENYQAQLEYHQMLRDTFGESGEYAGLLTDPIKSSSSTSEQYSQDTTPTFTAEGQTALTNMLQSAMSEQGRAESLPEFAGIEEGMARDYGAQMSGLKTALSNRASTRGAAPLDIDLEGILAGRGVTGDYLGRKQQLPGMREQARMGKNQVANMLFSNVAGLGRGSKMRGSRSSQTESEQGQGAGAVLNYMNMLRPPERTVYV
jgi:hypothetical protein